MSTVVVHQTGDKFEYSGNMDVAVQPEGVLVVLESMPDVTGKSEDGKMKRVRAVFAHYDRVEVS